MLHIFRKIKLLLRGILFVTLLTLFYIQFMRSAIGKFEEGATTIVESQRRGLHPDQPILMICPDPPFKLSFFKKYGLDGIGVDKYFWYEPIYQHHTGKFDNGTSVLDIYMNMSHILGQDWLISLYNPMNL